MLSHSDTSNTIYDINLGLFKKISKRITGFIMSKYSLDEEQAKKIQKEYYLKYGLTLRGLIVEKKLEPEEFLDYVHDVEHPELKKNDQLISNIRILEGKKIIFTNATSNHAKKILKILQLEHDFDQIIDIKEYFKSLWSSFYIYYPNDEIRSFGWLGLESCTMGIRNDDSRSLYDPWSYDDNCLKRPSKTFNVCLVCSMEQCCSWGDYVLSSGHR